MSERAGWRYYRVGPLGSLARGVGAALIAIPLIAVLMVAPFLVIRHVADRGAFGADATGWAWASWAELAVGVSILAFVLGSLLTSVLTFLRTVATLNALRRAIRRGARGSEVPHPQQWRMATGWTGATVIISAIITTAVLAFPPLLTSAVRTWVEDSFLAGPVVLVGLPVVSILMVTGYRLWRIAPLAQVQGRWTEELRSAAEAAAAARVPHLPTDADGDPVDPSTIHRKPMDAAGDRISTAGMWIVGIGILGAAITVPLGTSMISAGGRPSTTAVLLLVSSLLLLAGAIVCFVMGGLLQNSAQLAELRELFAAAQRPHGHPPGLSTLARYWRPLSYPWVDFIGLVGALVLLCAAPALLMQGPDAAQRWGSAGVVLAVTALLGAAVGDAAAEHVTRERRNVVMRRWPIPEPSTMNKEGRVDSAVQADVERYGQQAGTGSVGPAAPMCPPPSAPGPAAAASPGMAGHSYPPPSGQPYLQPAGLHPPPPGGRSAPPGPSPYSPPAAAPYPAPAVRPPPNGPYPPADPPPSGPGPLPGPAGSTGRAPSQPHSVQPPPSQPHSVQPPRSQPHGAQRHSARRAWGLPKKLRGRALGDLYR